MKMMVRLSVRYICSGLTNNLEGNRTITRTKITAPYAELGKKVQLECFEKCKAAAFTLSGRTDEDGKKAYRECMGTLPFLMDAKTLGSVRRVMDNDVKDVLAQANLTLINFRNKYAKIHKDMTDNHHILDIRRVLERQKGYVETVELTRNWRKNLVNDLREQSQPFLRRKF